MFFDLGYHAHGGSGLGYPWLHVIEMPMIEILSSHRLLTAQREAEADAIRKKAGK